MYRRCSTNSRFKKAKKQDAGVQRTLHRSQKCLPFSLASSDATFSWYCDLSDSWAFTSLLVKKFRWRGRETLLNQFKPKKIIIMPPSLESDRYYCNFKLISHYRKCDSSHIVHTHKQKVFYSYPRAGNTIYSQAFCEARMRSEKMGSFISILGIMTSLSPPLGFILLLHLSSHFPF